MQRTVSLSEITTFTSNEINQFIELGHLNHSKSGYHSLSRKYSMFVCQWDPRALHSAESRETRSESSAARNTRAANGPARRARTRTETPHLFRNKLQRSDATA